MTDASREVVGDGRFVISTDPARLDLDVIHGFLSRSYWSPGIPRETVAAAIVGSLCFGLFDDGRQIGFARLITDRATFAYLVDVFVLEEYRGRGLGQWLVATIIAHPSIRLVRRIMLATRNAHTLYARFGFRPLAKPENILELRPGSAAPLPHIGEKEAV